MFGHDDIEEKLYFLKATEGKYNLNKFAEGVALVMCNEGYEMRLKWTE